jgi:hypothetical protein
MDAFARALVTASLLCHDLDHCGQDTGVIALLLSLTAVDGETTTKHTSRRRGW